MTWLLGVRIVIMLLALRRFGSDARRVWRKQLPPTRLVLPLLIFTAALLVANAIVPRTVAMAGLLALDLLFLASCFMLASSLRVSAPHLRHQEQRLAHAFERFFPPAFARLVSIELTVYSHIGAGLNGVVNPPRAGALTYVNGSKIVMLAIILTLAIVPDAFMLWLLLPHHLWWLALVLDVLEIWSCGWLFGLYGTMIARPHEIGEEHATFYNGVLKRTEVSRDDIVAAASRDIKRNGVPVVEIELRGGKRLLIPSDAPDALVAVLS